MQLKYFEGVLFSLWYQKYLYSHACQWICDVL